jgi:hypothetical protein
MNIEVKDNKLLIEIDVSPTALAKAPVKVSLNVTTELL